MTRLEIETRIRQATLLTTSDISSANLIVIIDNGMEEISTHAFWSFLEKSATITAVATTQSYAVPADFLYGVAIVDDDDDTTVPFIAATEFFSRYGNDTGNTAATANFWTIWTDKVFFTPIPSTNDTNRWTFYYYRNITVLTGDSSVPEFHPSFHEALVEYVKWKVWEREEFFQQSQTSFTLYQYYLAKMEDFYAAQTKRSPFAWGEGTRRKLGDPNIPFIWRV